jgi:hypothetical protein
VDAANPHNRSRSAALRALARDPAVLAHLAKDLPWRAAYGRQPEAVDLTPGYTLVLPVPADLPVFLHLALQVAGRQDPQGRVETVVVPDHSTPQFDAAFEAARRNLDVGPLRLATTGWKGSAFRRLARSDPSKNYYMQIEAGTRTARTTHALLHDADLFIHDPGFLSRHYRRCADEGLACLGVSECWDAWLRDHGFGHVVATWELMLDVRWLRSFAAWEHRGRHAFLDGEWHGFDVTLYTQAVTPPERCALHDAEEHFEHFNWAISTYRHFHRGGDRPFFDSGFVLLLIRLLADALQPQSNGAGQSVDLPSIDQLVRGISDDSQPIAYTHAAAEQSYAEFRAKLSRILNGPLLEDGAAERIDRSLRPFDTAFAG